MRTTPYEVGELYITSDGNELYFHSNRTGGAGGLDIWVCKNVNGEWSIPENVCAVNSLSDEGWPALSPDGSELWFSKDYAVWRSIMVNGEWQTPEKMFSPLAGSHLLIVQKMCILRIITWLAAQLFRQTSM